MTSGVELVAWKAASSERTYRMAGKRREGWFEEPVDF
jgi:hypothetical protein